MDDNEEHSPAVAEEGDDSAVAGAALIRNAEGAFRRRLLETSAVGVPVESLRAAFGRLSVPAIPEARLDQGPAATPSGNAGSGAGSGVGPALRLPVWSVSRPTDARLAASSVLRAQTLLASLEPAKLAGSLGGFAWVSAGNDASDSELLCSAAAAALLEGIRPGEDGIGSPQIAASSASSVSPSSHLEFGRAKPEGQPPRHGGATALLLPDWWSSTMGQSRLCRAALPLLGTLPSRRSLAGVTVLSPPGAAGVWFRCASIAGARVIKMPAVPQSATSSSSLIPDDLEDVVSGGSLSCSERRRLVRGLVERRLVPQGPAIAMLNACLNLQSTRRRAEPWLDCTGVSSGQMHEAAARTIAAAAGVVVVQSDAPPLQLERAVAQVVSSPLCALAGRLAGAPRGSWRSTGVQLDAAAAATDASSGGRRGAAGRPRPAAAAGSDLATLASEGALQAQALAFSRAAAAAAGLPADQAAEHLRISRGRRLVLGGILPSVAANATADTAAAGAGPWGADTSVSAVPSALISPAIVSHEWLLSMAFSPSSFGSACMDWQRHQALCAGASRRSQLHRMASRPSRTLSNAIVGKPPSDQFVLTPAGSDGRLVYASLTGHSLSHAADVAASHRQSRSTKSPAADTLDACRARPGQQPIASSFIMCPVVPGMAAAEALARACGGSNRGSPSQPPHHLRCKWAPGTTPEELVRRPVALPLGAAAELLSSGWSAADGMALPAQPQMCGIQLSSAQAEERHFAATQGPGSSRMPPSATGSCLAVRVMSSLSGAGSAAGHAAVVAGAARSLRWLSARGREATAASRSAVVAASETVASTIQHLSQQWLAAPARLGGGSSGGAASRGAAGACRGPGVVFSSAVRVSGRRVEVGDVCFVRVPAAWAAAAMTAADFLGALPADALPDAAMQPAEEASCAGRDRNPGSCPRPECVAGLGIWDGGLQILPPDGSASQGVASSEPSATTACGGGFVIVMARLDGVWSVGAPGGACRASGVSLRTGSAAATQAATATGLPTVAPTQAGEVPAPTSSVGAADVSGGGTAEADGQPSSASASAGSPGAGRRRSAALASLGPVWVGSDGSVSSLSGGVSPPFARAQAAAGRRLRTAWAPDAPLSAEAAEAVADAACGGSIPRTAVAERASHRLPGSHRAGSCASLFSGVKAAVTLLRAARPAAHKTSYASATMLGSGGLGCGSSPLPLLEAVPGSSTWCDAISLLGRAVVCPEGAMPGPASVLRWCAARGVGACTAAAGAVTRWGVESVARMPAGGRHAGSLRRCTAKRSRRAHSTSPEPATASLRTALSVALPLPSIGALREGMLSDSGCSANGVNPSRTLEAEAACLPQMMWAGGVQMSGL